MSFLSPLFLIGLAAAAIPVVLHLVRRATARVVSFPSLMLLQATQHRQVRRRRLRDVLLLLLRSAALALLAVAFARPFVAGSDVPLITTRERVTTVLLVDRSMSMQAQDRFDRARSEARDVIDGMEAGDFLSVVAFDDAGQQLTPVDDDPSLHRAVVDGLEPSYRPTDAYRALRAAEEILIDAPTDKRRLVLVSDMQQSAWSEAVENWKLASDIEFVPVSVASDEVANRSVADFALSTFRAGSDVVIRYEALLGGSAGGTTPVELVLDDETSHRDAVTGRFSHQERVTREGVSPGYVRIAGDGLEADNTHYFTRVVRSRPAIFGFDGAARDGVRDGLFLETAFDLGDAALYRYEARSLGALSAGGLRGAQVVFLLGADGLTNGQIEALDRFVRGGGGVILGFGGESGADGSARLFRALELGEPQALVDTRQSFGGETIIGEVDRRHPVFSVFESAGAGAIFRPRFRTYVRVAADSAATVIARYDSGDPFVIERRLGRGTVLAMTSSFGPSWTDFPVNELYVPFVYQLVAYALGSGQASPSYEVGEPVLFEGSSGDTWDVRTPDDRSFRVAIEDDGSGVFRETGVPGHYLAVKGSERRLFAVNVDPAESDLTARDTEEVYAAVVAPAREREGNLSETASMTAADVESRQKLWRYAIMVILALFAAESVLAHRRAAGAPGNQ